MRGMRGSKRDLKEAAQEIAFDAMDATTWERRMSLVRQALELDPENVDALLMAEEVCSLNPEERIQILRGIVATGARALGKNAFKELVPHFWGFMETRPYMRAREWLATALYDAQRLEEAAEEYMEMLTLNENDNQGIRYLLLPVLLRLGRLDAASALMKRYEADCDWSVVFAWGRVLFFLISGDEGGATKALASARANNSHIEVYLRGHRKLPKKYPE